MRLKQEEEYMYAKQKKLMKKKWKERKKKHS